MSKELIKLNLVQGEVPLNDWFFSSKIINKGEVIYSLYDDKQELVEEFKDPIEMELAILEYERNDLEKAR